MKSKNIEISWEMAITCRLILELLGKLDSDQDRMVTLLMCIATRWTTWPEKRSREREEVIQMLDDMQPFLDESVAWLEKQLRNQDGNYGEH